MSLLALSFRVQPDLCCFALAFLCPVQWREFRTFPLKAQGLLVWDVEPASPVVWDETCQTLGVSPWQADLQSRFVRLWKLKCLKLIPVLGRKKKQLMELVIGGKREGCLQEALVIEPIVVGRGQALLCSPNGTHRSPARCLPGIALNKTSRIPSSQSHVNPSQGSAGQEQELLWSSLRGSRGRGWCRALSAGRGPSCVPNGPRADGSLLGASSREQAGKAPGLKGRGFGEGDLGLFPSVGVTEGTHICINSSVPTNAYLCGIKANGFGFNTAGSDKCQCSLEFKTAFICKYPLLQNHTRNVFPVSRTGSG